MCNFLRHMFKTKTRADATDPTPSISNRTTRRTPPSSSTTSTSTSTATTSYGATDSARATSSAATSTSASSHSSLASLRSSLPENSHIYSFSEISSATNNFLSKPISSSTWRCTLRSKPTAVVQRRLRRPLDSTQLRFLLSSISRTHHTSIIKLLGACISGDFIYLVYDFASGATLSTALRNPQNPSFTLLPSWLSRMQIATDLSQGLEYIHHSSGENIIHNHIKSSAIIVSDPSLNARICHFGASLLTGETPEASSSSSSSSTLQRSDSRASRVEGTRGYMSPEFLTAGIISQKSDVYAFGVVILELFSGEEPLKYRFDGRRGDYERISLIETARDALERNEDGMLRRWMDRRMKDSFPAEVAEKMIRLALDCVHVEADKRPDISRVAGKVSKLYLDSRVWAERMKIPTEISVSLAAR
ncbi:pto-interacting protein 1-like [Magnolia sinica]|uniref:pto-interacting protein 1-like n=1 Tax=Magnolia sinica TaxID=86752 RepID=UPI00265ACDA7|nr:pto-interacting protein 1-like [Magnolia sinica]